MEDRYNALRMYDFVIHTWKEVDAAKLKRHAEKDLRRVMKH